MMNHKRLRLTQIALSLSIALAAAPSFAQNTTSAIGGRISASDGKPAGGATVTILHVESGSTSNVTTDAEGRYVARGLRAGGPYTITITKNGVSEKRENVFVEVAETASVDAQLGAAMQTVTVAGVAGGRNEKFSKTSMGTGTSISASELAIQASIARNLQDYARTDPRVAQTDKDRGEMSVAGQNSRYNSMTIDGVAVSDTFGLESNGSPTAKQPISIEAIQSVQVNVANYDVTQKGYTGGNINAVTKSGTNTVKGSVYYVFRNDKLAGDRYNATTDDYYAPPPFKETTKGFTLGAPLIKDKLFIFANYEKLESSPSRNTPAFGPLGSDKTNVGITPAAIAQAQSIAKSQYNLDIGGSQVPDGTALTVEDKLVKLDWNINDDHRAMVRFSRTEQSEPFFNNFNTTNLSLSSHWYDQKKKIDTIVGQWLADWTPNFSTEFKVSSRDYDSVPNNAAKLPAMALSFSGALPAGAPASLGTASRSLNFGTENSRQYNVLKTKTKDAYLGANWSLGDHEIKFGTDYSKNDVFNAFLQNVNGNYTFACVNGWDYKTVSLPGGLCSNLTPANMEAAVLENFRRGRPSSYTYQVAAPGASLERDATANFSMKNYGLFLQDTWSVNPRLTLSYGLRVDYTSIGDRPRANAAVASPLVAATAASGGRQTGGFGLDNTKTFDGQKLWQPRLGFNYNMDTTRRTQLRGGVGLFQGNAAAVWLGNPFQNNGVSTLVYSCGSANNACPTTDGTFSTDPNKQPTNFQGSAPIANVDVLAPGLRQPSVWKANLAVDHELPWEGIVLSGELLRTQTRDGIYYQNANLGAPTKIGTDGRELFHSPQGYQTNCWRDDGQPNRSGTFGGTNCNGFREKFGSNAKFGNVMVATPTSKGFSNMATLSLSRPMISGLAYSMAYTFTQAKEVSPLTSSTSGSNFNGRSIFHPNEEKEENSSYLVKDRINASVSFRKAFFGTYRTTFGLFYEGRSGKPYSWTFNNDLNGDSVVGNDLMYIPSKPGSGEVVFLGDTASSHANEDRFWSIVEANRGLRNSKGGVVSRNNSFSNWTNSFDMRISQEIPSFIQGHKASFTFDIFNVGNLLNKKWGRINEVLFQGGGAQARSFVDFAGLDSQGRYIYRLRDKVEDLEVRQSKGESQWAIQATLKYEF
ncbi:TonB-dependent receptor [Massilia sp. BJB1822]|uniref:TonB-dependent receptor n=1 Tax=Massilia sp. BJB1822 TaxID=2744470 RepID=UPI0015934526|nr:TonB-dependent receptor [Massilia sp. BJB1822]NVD99179.1 TonB-dependent receptor [Massilia sp. BJB1822]